MQNQSANAAFEASMLARAMSRVQALIEGIDAPAVDAANRAADVAPEDSGPED